MINITYNRKENQIIVLINEFIHNEHSFPLSVKFVDIVTKNVSYEEQVNKNTWVTWVGGEVISNVLIYTNDGNLLYEWKWHPMDHGNVIEKLLWVYLKDKQNKNISSNGLVIGTHDGRFGHWVYPVVNGMSDAVLIEGGNDQYNNLTKNFERYTNTSQMNVIVTTDGNPVDWYEGGEGYTNTIKKEHIHKWFNSNEITVSSKSSVSITDIMENELFDWIHMDVEGIDSDLIMSFNYYPNLIIYETMNLNENQLKNLEDWFDNNNYKLLNCGENSIAIKSPNT